MSKSGIGAVIVFLLITLTAYPSVALSPIQENNESLFIVQGSSVKSFGLPHLSLPSASYGVLIAKSEYYHLLIQYDWDYDKAYNIMLCESGGNKLAYNPERHKGCSGSFGLFQIACVHSNKFEKIEDLLDPEINIRIAHEIYLESGWNAWKRCNKLNS